MKSVNVFADIGASLGQYTKLAAEVIKSGNIYSVEADPLRYEVLKASSVKWAELGSNSISVLNKAVTSKSGMLSFHVTGTNVSGAVHPSSLDHLDAEARSKVEWRSVEVEGCTIDDLFADVQPEFIKMDIEGEEFAALQGAARVHEKSQTSWLIELHDFLGPDRTVRSADTVKLMKSYGYHCIALDTRGHWMFFKGARAPLFSEKVKSIFFRFVVTVRRALKALLKSTRAERSIK